MNEKLDLYNFCGELTGDVIERKEGFKTLIPENNFYKISALIITNNDNEVLLQKTSFEKGDEWALLTGHVKSGNTSLECIIEEAKEEMAIDITENDIKRFNTFRTDINQMWDVYFAKLDLNVSDFKYQKDEVSFAKFFNITDIKLMIKNKLIRNTDKSIILDYLLRKDK